MYLLHEADGSRRVVRDRMVLGVFPGQTWERLLGEAGFATVSVVEQSGRDVFRAVAA